MATRWAAERGKTLTPGSWDECVSWLLSRGGEGVIYRGQKRLEWPLQSSLERALLSNTEKWDKRKYELMLGMAADTSTEQWTSNVEDALLQRFREQAVRYDIPNLPEAWDILGWWEVMQHHGAPTRLLDWSTSPFIAAWFALDGHQTEIDGDMALWIYDRSAALIFLREAIEYLRTSEDYQELNDRQFQNRLIKFALEKGRRIQIPVRPRQFSRAVAQQSALTVSSDIGVGRPASWWVRENLTTRIKLGETWKPQIQDTCRSMGFSRPSLFRDLDNLGKSIAQVFEDGFDLLDPYASF